MNLRELLGSATSAEVLCAYKGTVMRQLAVLGGDAVDIHAGADVVGVTLDTELTFQAWTMDRGSILFTDCQGRQLKLCTELDPIRLGDGRTVALTWDDSSHSLEMYTQDIAGPHDPENYTEGF